MTPLRGHSIAYGFAFLLALTGTIPRANAETPAPVTVAVMEFAATRTGPDQAENQWLTKGITDLLIGDLGQLPGLRLVTREHALMLAEEAELRTDLAARGAMPEEELKKLNAHLKVDHAVFGTYTVEGDRITVQAQVINSSNGVVLAKFAQDGLLADALTVEKGLARKMLSFFGGTDRPVDSIPLPKWTDSAAAAKRLYEGVAAFDAGKYNLAWYRFRQALSTDPHYADARYWGARMYYYRQEYDHARVEYKRFVDEFPSHSRVGDAVMEYIHSQECGATSATNTLDLYRAFREREFKDVEVHNQVDYVGTSPLSDWLLKREQQALVYLGRLGEAFALLDQDLRNLKSTGKWQDESRILMSAIAEAAEDEHGERLISDQAPYKDIELTIDLPEVDEDLSGQPMKGTAYHWGTNYRILAPTGYAFKAVKAHVISSGDPSITSVCRLQVRRYRYVDINSCWVDSVDPKPRVDHVFNVTMPPGCTWFYLRPEYDGRPPHGLRKGSSPPKSVASFDAWRIEAECVPVGNGRVLLNVANAHEFRVLVDGVYTRCYNGSLGSIPPGEHILRVEGMFPGAAWGYIPYETNLVVIPGQTQQLHLSLQLTNTVAGWQDPVGIALEYPTYKHRPQRNENWRNGSPSIAVNPRTGARVAVWAHLDDLWFSVCTNGTVWSAPDTLPPPVNSAHVDLNPRLIIDDRERFCLLFLSDRGQERNLCAYASWSRDLKAWSRPVQVSSAHFSDLDLIQAQDGRYIMACAQAPGLGMDKGDLALRTSRDLVSWADPIKVPLKGTPELVAIRQDSEGVYHLAWTWADSARIVSYLRSQDLSKWSSRFNVLAQKNWHPRSLALEVLDDTIVMATCVVDGSYAGGETLTLNGLPLHTNNPTWRPMTFPPGTIVGMPSLTRDPRTKDLLLAWQVGDLVLSSTRSSGPVFVMAGRPQFVVLPEMKPLQHAQLIHRTTTALEKRMANQSLTQKELNECSQSFQEYGELMQERGMKEDLEKSGLLVDQAEHYIFSMKMAVIDPDRHSGWPFRHFAIRDVYPILQKQASADTDAVRLAAVIIPAIVNDKTDNAVQAYQWLAAKDPFWSHFIVETIRESVPQGGDFLARVGAPHP